MTVHYEVTRRAVAGMLHEHYHCICAYLPLFIKIKYRMIFGKTFSLFICFLKSSEIHIPAGTASASILKEVIMNELTVYSLCYKRF